MSTREAQTEIGREPHADDAARSPASDRTAAELAGVLSAFNQVVLDHIPGLELFDAHTHLGQNDPDGMRQRPEELLSGLTLAHARGAFVFPMHEPDGYCNANDMVLAAARDSGGALVPFARVDPHQRPVPEAERCLDAGARGIKLHPRAEQFTLDHPAVRDLVALAHERRVPVLIHAGRGIPALGVHAVELAGAFPEARLILAHAGICDLSWIWEAAPDHPNLLFDTAWWMPTDLITLFSLVPAGQVVFASDSPYGSTLMSSSFQLRLALQAGLSGDQIRSVASGQALRLAAGEALLPAGPPLGEREQAPHVLLERLAQFVLLAVIELFRGGDGAEMLALARLACDIPSDIDDAPVFAAVLGLLDLHARLSAANPDDRRVRALLILAASVARSPDVPLPPVQ
ncbi:MAG: amidohydrolase family protein [Solirubrobacterales bacterium]|nr:amidohydrolase family protein [Solirubrobacterales bacterium]MBV9535919.1 amidohydrolase family protein [Solirubrobacterales bacterium]